MHRNPNLMHRVLDTINIEFNRLMILAYFRTRKIFN